MDDKRIRQIVQDEIKRSSNRDRFGYSTIPFHTHNGKDAPKILEDNLQQNPVILGSIEFSSQADYILNLNSTFTPTEIIAYSNIVGSGGERFVSTGSAYLTPSFYFQPLSNRSVQTGTLQYPFNNYPAQTSVYFGTDSGGTRRTVVSEFAIVSVEYPLGTVHAQMKIKDFGRSSVTVEVTVLDAGWTINSSIVIK